MLSGRKSKLLSSEQPTLTATCLVSNEEASTSSVELEESASCCGTYRYRIAAFRWASKALTLDPRLHCAGPANKVLWLSEYATNLTNVTPRGSYTEACK